MRQRTRRLGSICAIILLDGIAVSMALFLAFFLRFDGDIPDRDLAIAWDWLPYILTIRILCIAIATRYRPAWSFTSIRDLWGVIHGVTLGSLAIGVAIGATHAREFPRGVLILEWFLAINLLTGNRIAARVMRTAVRKVTRRLNGQVRNVLIVGAGETGACIARSLQEDPSARMRPIGFVDDDPLKWRQMIHGMSVLGSTQQIPAIAQAHRVHRILIAIPSLSGADACRITRICSQVDAELTILPGLPQTLWHQPSLAIRKIRVEDLLQREPLDTNLADHARYVKGERILVTGAGGSIGSELCRQLSRLGPECLIILGHGENSVFWIEQELRSACACKILPVIADIKDRGCLEYVFSTLEPTVVFHAAAHKHVPLMEQNPGEAVKNNVVGTRNLAELSVSHHVKTFVMISSDKAVNPTSVMGATKRVAEMIVQSLAQRIQAARAGEDRVPAWGFEDVRPEEAATRLAAVRFGNVMGSRGSVIPTMQKQIEHGGPVTITHPEMERFFMTIPEAVQLVIRAGAMAANGQVFVLDMGKPVKIVDLAQNLIRLSGFTPERDIRIEITGVRPGEKLYEEVLTAEEGTTTTAHDKIFMARSTLVDHDALFKGLRMLEQSARTGDADHLRHLLRRLVPSYQPNDRPVAAPRPAESVPERTPVHAAPRRQEAAPAFADPVAAGLDIGGVE